MAWHRAADPVDPEEAFLQAVTGQVRFRPDRAAIAEELRAHLEESARDLEEAEGLSPEEARAEALKRMGDPAAVGEGLNLTHNPALGWAWWVSRGLCVFTVVTLGLYLVFYIVSLSAMSLVRWLEYGVFYRYSEPVERVVKVDRTFDLGAHTMTIDEAALLESGDVVVRVHSWGEPRVTWTPPNLQIRGESGEGYPSGSTSLGGLVRWEIYDFTPEPGETTFTLGWPSIDPAAVVTVDLSGEEGAP